MTSRFERRTRQEAWPIVALITNWFWLEATPRQIEKAIGEEEGAKALGRKSSRGRLNKNLKRAIAKGS